MLWTDCRIPQARRPGKVEGILMQTCVVSNAGSRDLNSFIIPKRVLVSGRMVQAWSVYVLRWRRF
jgi:hypothetical protein